MNSRNNLKEIREAKMLGKTELAKLAGISIDPIEKGMPCRIKTQRQIVLALGLKLSQRLRVFREN